MNILWFTWKDRSHPQAGGAELLNEEVARLCVMNGHFIKFIVGGYKNCTSYEERDGFSIIRLGNRLTVYWKAFWYYRTRLQGWADVVIDECNTLPFFCKFYVKEPSYFLIQQLAREVWFYQMVFPLNLIGFMLEPLYLRLLRDQPTFTFARSTTNDLVSYGFKRENITLLKETYTINKPNNPLAITKYEQPSLLFLSSIRPMKRPDHVIIAFERAKRAIPTLQLHVAGGGDGSYLTHITNMMRQSRFSDSIHYHGHLAMNDPKKIELMRRCHFICCTSVREGWGIIVSEAGSQGTPAIVYDVHGLRDAVDYGNAGIITKKNSSDGLAKSIITAFSDKTDYDKLRSNVAKFASEVSADASYRVFIDKLQQLTQRRE